MYAFSSPQRQSFVREVADEVMSRLGEVLPRYNDWMQHGGNFNVSFILIYLYIIDLSII